MPTVEEPTSYLELKAIFSNSTITWINENGFLMQTKSEANKKSFYIVEIIKEQNMKENVEELSIKLTPINFMLSKIEVINEKPIIFKELKE